MSAWWPCLPLYPLQLLNYAPETNRKGRRVTHLCGSANDLNLPINQCHILSISKYFGELSPIFHFGTFWSAPKKSPDVEDVPTLLCDVITFLWPLTLFNDFYFLFGGVSFKLQCYIAQVDDTHELPTMGGPSRGSKRCFLYQVHRRHSNQNMLHQYQYLGKMSSKLHEM